MIKLNLFMFGGSGSGSGIGGYTPSWKLKKGEAQSKGIIGQAADKVKAVFNREKANPNIITKIDKNATYDVYRIENNKEELRWNNEIGEDVAEILRGYKVDKDGIWRKNGKAWRLVKKK